MGELSISIRGLYKNYGEVRALDGIDLDISSGEIFGILGPNGSGKTTLLRIMCSILEPTIGYVSVNGLNAIEKPLRIKEISGYVPETPILNESLTPLEFLTFIGSVRRIELEVLSTRIQSFAEAFEIMDKMDNFIGSLPFGTKQKVAIISALIHDPQVIILDEAMNGLDPRSARILKNLLINYALAGRTIIFSTHVLEVAESVCNRMAIIYRGKIVDVGTFKEMKEKSGSKDAKLEDIFLKMTGDTDLTSIVNSLGETMNH